MRGTTDVERMQRALPIVWFAVPVAAILVERAVHGVYAAYYLAPTRPPSPCSSGAVRWPSTTASCTARRRGPPDGSWGPSWW